MTFSRYVIRTVSVPMAISTLLAGSAAHAAAQTGPFDNPETLLRGLYAAVSWEPGQSADWDHVRAFFLPEAVFCMRKTRTTMEVMSLDEFIQWFIDDVERMNMTERGFEEIIERLELTEFGETAHAFVVYRARFKTPADLPGSVGLDSFGMLRLDGRWWIASVTNEVVTPDRPLPERLRLDSH